jgi:hypothetical protein
MSPELTVQIVGELRKDMICRLAMLEATLGKEIANAFAEGSIDAATTFLTGSIGASAAYDLVQQRADAIGAPIMADRAKRP